MLYAIASEDEMLGEYAKVFWDFIKDEIMKDFKCLAKNKRKISKSDLRAMFYRAALEEVRTEAQNKRD